jgi:hypothetical protein
MRYTNSFFDAVRTKRTEISAENDSSLELFYRIGGKSLLYLESEKYSTPYRKCSHFLLESLLYQLRSHFFSIV